MYKTKIKIRKIVKISQVDMSDIVSGADCRILYCLVTLYTIFLVILYTSRNFSLSYNNTTIRIVFLGIPAAVLATCTYGIPQSSL